MMDSKQEPKTALTSKMIWLRFLLIFTILLVGAELLLQFNHIVQDKLSDVLLGIEMPKAGQDIIIALSSAIFYFLLLIMLFAAIEWRNKAKESFFIRYKDGIIYSSIALIFSILVQAAEYYIFEAAGVQPLFSSDQFGSFLLFIPLVLLLIIGFMEYWLHRALHHYEFLWRFHAIHHQITGLNSARSYSHIGEIFIYILCIITPIILLVDAPQNHIALVTTFYIVSNYYMHSDSPLLSFPPALRHIFADNIYHHYHHSKDIQHFGNNYASFLSFFDRIFGTQHMPDTEVFPPTGIDGYRPINSVRDYLVRPFHSKAE